jgi:DNA-binding IclR family transcriptional regulator
MRRVRELLRRHYGTGASARVIARELGVSRSTVKDYLARAAAVGLTWPLPDELTDGAIEERLFAASGSKPGVRRRAEPDRAALAGEMKRPGVNLTVLASPSFVMGSRLQEQPSNACQERVNAPFMFVHRSAGSCAKRCLLVFISVSLNN